MRQLADVSLQPRLDAARRALAERPDGVLESIAEASGLSLGDVLALLSDEEAVAADGSTFDAVWQELTGWGPVLFLIHNRDGVFEIKTALSPGSRGGDYFNVHGEAALGGHLRADRCRTIWFVDRPFFGRRSCSVQFLDAAGSAMFKIYVRRDAERALDAVQLAKFEMLKQRYAEG